MTGKNEHAQALGKLKKGVVEKVSQKKADSSRLNIAKAREAKKVKSSSAPKTESNESN